MEENAPNCIDDMKSVWILKCKHVFMHHRKFFPLDHQYRKKKKTFNGEVEDHVARQTLTD